MAKRREWRTKTIIVAWCHDCGKTWESPNAHGVGAQHARKHEHYVAIDRTITYVYDHTPGGGHEEADDD